MGLISMSQTLGFVGKLFDNRVATEAIIKPTVVKPPVSPAGKNDIPRCAPEEQGISSSVIRAFLLALKQDRTLNMHSVSVMRNGKIVCEATFGNHRLDIWKYTFSACKSVVSLAIGLLIDDGLLSLRDRVTDIFPKESGAMGKIKLKDLTIEDLLTMRSSVSFAEADSVMEEDWVKGFWNAPTKGNEGSTFHYNSLNTYMLSVIVSAKTGRTLSDFLHVRLFSLLGIKRESWHWETCPKGFEKGGWGLYMRQDDFLKIAQLVMQKGIWNGKQIISAEYIEAATAKHVAIEAESTLFDYGYQIWVGKQTETFLFNGMLGQNIIGFWKNGIIIACNAGNDELFQQSNFFHYVEKYFNRSFPECCTKNRKETRRLYRVIQRDLKWQDNMSWLQKKREQWELSRLIGKTFRLIDGFEKSVGILPLLLQIVHNEYTKGFVSLSFVKQEQTDVLVYKEQGNTVTVPLNGQATVSFGNNRFLVASSTRVKHDEEDRPVVTVRIDFLEFPCSRIIKLIFLDSETVLMRNDEAPGSRFVKDTAKFFLADLTEKSIVNSILDRVGYDYIDYRIERMFSPRLILSTQAERKSNARSKSENMMEDKQKTP